MLTKFKNCAVDVEQIMFVSGNAILFDDGQRIESANEQFSDVAEYFSDIEAMNREATSSAAPASESH